jgi:ABC-type molybdate transport system substrate-binding protein
MAHAQPHAQQYLEFLSGPAARAIFQRYGFRVVGTKP